MNGPWCNTDRCSTGQRRVSAGQLYNQSGSSTTYGRIRPSKTLRRIDPTKNLSEDINSLRRYFYTETTTTTIIGLYSWQQHKQQRRSSPWHATIIKIGRIAKTIESVSRLYILNWYCLSSHCRIKLVYCYCFRIFSIYCRSVLFY